MSGIGPPQPPQDDSATPLGAARLDAVRRGDPEAIDAFYRAEHREVYRLCLGFLADAAEADDLAQDAMLKLIDSMQAYDPGRSYPAWRNTLVLNTCRDRLRRIATRRRAEQSAADLGPGAALPAPDARLHAEEVRALLARALGALTPREREVFVLRDLQGESTRDVAATMGIGTSSVRSLLTLARRRLRQLLGPALAQVGGSAPGADA